MQFDYAVLFFDNLHISKKVEKLLRKDDYEFKVHKNFEDIIDKINEYHGDSWIVKEYKQTLLNLKNYKDNIDFELIACSIEDKTTKKIVAGEIGYKVGAVYTSLSGFSSKERRFNNYGKLQLVLLAKYLEKNGFSFWNLGHPYMKYKFDLGATLHKRKDFLNIFRKYRDKKI
jgi:Leu/Phe-tRNA-protein transferase